MATTTEKQHISRKASPKEVLRCLHLLFEAEKSMPGEERQAPLIVGSPGASKTAIVKQFQQELDKMLKAKGKNGASLVVLRLTQSEISDLKGIPVYAELNGKTVCNFAAPSLFPIVGMPDSAGGKDMVVIFMDELKQAYPALQQMAGNILDGIIGDHQLDFSRTFIIAAGNLKTDGATTHELPTNLLRRFTEISLEPIFSDWKEWAMSNGQQIEPTIMSFLEDKTQYFSQPVNKSGVFANPASWHKLSNLLLSTKKDKSDWYKDPIIKLLIESRIGSSVASEFIAYSKNYYESVNLDNVEKGKDEELSSNTAVQLSISYDIFYRVNSYLAKVEKTLDLKDLVNSKTKITFESLAQNDLLDDLKKASNLFKWFVNKKCDPSILRLLTVYGDNKLLIQKLMTQAFKDNKEYSGFFDYYQVIISKTYETTRSGS